EDEVPGLRNHVVLHCLVAEPDAAPLRLDLPGDLREELLRNALESLAEPLLEAHLIREFLGGFLQQAGAVARAADVPATLGLGGQQEPMDIALALVEEAGGQNELGKPRLGAGESKVTQAD